MRGDDLERCPVTDGECSPVPVEFRYGIEWLCGECGYPMDAPDVATREAGS